MKKLCLFCKKEIKDEDYRIKYRKYCSCECASLMRHKRKISKCVLCGKEFEHHSCYDRKFCKRSCYQKYWGKNMLTHGKKYRFSKKHNPWNKGKPFYKVRGKNHHMWKGGITPLVRAVRTLREMDEWRKFIYERDDYTCVICGSRGNKLNADHIISFRTLIRTNNITSLEDARKCEKLWDVSNGRTLCVPCHKNTKNYGLKYKSHPFINS